MKGRASQKEMQKPKKSKFFFYMRDAWSLEKRRPRSGIYGRAREEVWVGELLGKSSAVTNENVTVTGRRMAFLSLLNTAIFKRADWVLRTKSSVDPLLNLFYSKSCATCKIALVTQKI
jgi:hypothetical protein